MCVSPPASRSVGNELWWPTSSPKRRWPPRSRRRAGTSSSSWLPGRRGRPPDPGGGGRERPAERRQVHPAPHSRAPQHIRSGRSHPDQRRGRVRRPTGREDGGDLPTVHAVRRLTGKWILSTARRVVESTPFPRWSFVSIVKPFALRAAIHQRRSPERRKRRVSRRDMRSKHSQRSPRAGPATAGSAIPLRLPRYSSRAWPPTRHAAALSKPVSARSPPQEMSPPS
jgi:hypothetical protein